LIKFHLHNNGPSGRAACFHARRYADIVRILPLEFSIRIAQFISTDNTVGYSAF
jgi:hypothetical protein